MEQKGIFTEEQDSDTLHYASFFDDFNISYIESEYHLHVSTTNAHSGWVLYISINPYNLVANMSKILGFLISISIPFKIIKNYKLHEQINNGDLGSKNIGKVISLMFENDEQIAKHINEIQTLTKNWWGPRVNEAQKISSLLYSSFEIFDTKTQINKYSIEENPFFRYSDGNFTEITNKSEVARKYKIQNTIRDELGCTYYKATLKNENNENEHYIIKCAYRGFKMDPFGPDAADRNTWQYQSIERLKIKSELPTVEFEESYNKNFIVINYSNGILMNQLIQSVLNGAPWSKITNQSKLKLLQCWQNITEFIQRLHQKKITINNLSIFDILVTHNNDIIPINWECLYTQSEDLPNPTFRCGKRGFRSPDQIKGNLPEFSDDIFSLGAIILSSCTEIPVYRLYDNNKENFRQKLNFLINQEKLENIIFNCLSDNRIDRPSVVQIIEELAALKTEIVSPREKRLSQAYSINEKISLTIDQSIQGLGNAIVLQDNLWFSEADKNSQDEIHEENKKKICHGLYGGIEGVLYFLCQAIRAGIDVTPLSHIVKRSIEYIDKIDSSDLNKIGSSLYYGSSGVAVALKEIISLGIIQNKSNYLTTIKHCYSNETRGKNILQGAAGEGVGLIQCASLFEKEDYDKLLNLKITNLLNQQKSDGSWDLQSENKTQASYSFGYGIAGIVYFLLEAADHHNLNNCITASEHGIDYLTKNLPIFSAKAISQSNVSTRENNFSWCYGLAGIALPFLKTYKLSGSKSYLLAAENALRSVPQRIFSKNLGQCHGLAGLGEVYLELYMTTKSEEWWERATLIADNICSLKLFTTDNSVYWLSENSQFPTAGFMTGNSGIIHFLTRYLGPNEIGLPFLK